MPAFELPELYMPYPARLNANMDSTRVHCKAWAYEMGMLGGGEGFTWDEATYDGHDLPALCGYTHPDLPASELDLMSDWHVWLFFFDDHFLETYKRGHDMAGGKEYLARLWAFLPLEPTSSLPSAVNPVERGMVDLWLRTAPGTTLDWRRRFIGNTKDMLEAVVWELSNISDSRVANPLEYVQMRRIGGGLAWAADLLERANKIELPESVLASRPLRVLQDCYADIVSIHNDLMSYTREVQDEGENCNAVLVFEEFLDATPQRAANITGDMLASRTHQFENTVMTELPLLFEEYALPPQQRVDVLRYANGLMAWLAGTYEWHANSTRYDDFRASDSQRGLDRRQLYVGPTGMGTSASRMLSTIGLRSHTAAKGEVPKPPAAGPFDCVGFESPRGFERPCFHMPFSAKLNPGVRAAREHTREWATAMGMLGAGVWTPASFERDDLPLKAGYVTPEANISALKLTSDWCVWSYYVSDYFLEMHKRRRDLLGARAFAGRLSCFVGADPRLTVSPVNPAERGLADLWQRSTLTMSFDQRRTFAGRIQSYITSALWEILNTIQGRTPDPIDYYEMRRVTGRGELALSMLGLGRPALSPQVLRSCPMQQMMQAFSDVMPLQNDLVSYDKELRSEGEYINSVVVLQRFFGCDAARGATLTNALISARIEQFEYLNATSLPVMFEDLELDEAARARVQRFIQSLEDWMAGDLAWTKRTGRYDGCDTKLGLGPRQATSLTHNPVGSGPTGLGTSAARIHTALRQHGAGGAGISGASTGGPALHPAATQTQTLDEALREIVKRTYSFSGQ